MNGNPNLAGRARAMRQMRALTLGVKVAGRPSLHFGNSESIPASLKFLIISRTRSSEVCTSLAITETFWPWADASTTVACRQVTMSLAPRRTIRCSRFASFSLSSRTRTMSPPLDGSRKGSRADRAQARRSRAGAAIRTLAT